MLWHLSALEAADQIRSGQITSVELVKSCLAQIDDTDEAIGAWAHIDSDAVIAQAETMDQIRLQGRPTGALHGVPVGIKDIFDTADMPTGWGTDVHKDRQPNADAAIIEKLREAGAIILGKTVTTPLAFASPSATRNPHNADHTPGGSSAGSAAGVAAGHMPLAVGSQTNGSVVRPASYCGVFGYKPSRGLISRRGCLQTSQTLDQVGVFGRTLEDVALISDALIGYDHADLATHTRPKPQLLHASRQEAPMPPNLVWFDIAYNDKMTDAMRSGLDELIDALGERVERIEAPQSFLDVVEHQHIVHQYEFNQNLGDDPATAADQIDDVLAAILERARGISDEDYTRSLEYVDASMSFFAEFFNDYDAIISPSALGVAPEMGEGTGDPICSTIWTFAGLPCLSLPWLTGEHGLPAGVQLIGAQDEDDRLFRTTAWLERHLSQTDDEDAANV